MDYRQAGEAKFCTLCQIEFPSFIAYHRYKINFTRHICCGVCSQDFNTHEAFKLHHDLMHSAKQDLQCPGCGKLFTRLGGLIGHIELADCPGLPRQHIEHVRKEKQQMNAMAQSAHDFNDFNRSGRSFPQEPLPLPLARSPKALPQGQSSFPQGPYNAAQYPVVLPRGHSGGSFAQEQQPMAQSRGTLPPSQAQHSLSKPPGAPPPSRGGRITVTSTGAVFHDDDLIGNLDMTDLTEAVMDAPRGEENTVLANVIRSKLEDLPALSTTIPNIMDVPPVSATPAAPAVAATSGNACAVQNPSPNALLAVTTTTPIAAIQHTQDVVAPSNLELESAPFDPDTPCFHASKFYIPLISKWKCPHFGCGKSFATLPTFIGHLKSPTHRNEKLQCTNCLRYYASATALTQHMESQGVRCKVRESAAYNIVLDEVTGGMAVAAGRHRDNTVKYTINCSMLDPAGGVFAANKAAQDAKNEAFNSYWSQRQPKW